jgi:hypothetical protein
MYALSIHADYRCRHAGACCSAGWDVPVEVPLYRRLEEALGAGRLRPAAEAFDGAPFITDDDLPDDAAAIVAQTRTGDCVFYHRSSGLCVVHRDLGEPQLPSACRHFPRVALTDVRGTFISLSHYCPTAASMLFRDEVPLAIVEAPPAFPPAEYEGLVVTPDAWPPLLRPKMLMDIDGYDAWERHMVGRCANPVLSPEAVVATLERDARVARGFRPNGRSLTAVVRALPRDTVEAPSHVTLEASLDLHEEVLRAVPEEYQPGLSNEGLGSVFVRDVTAEWARWHAPLKRYLAAKAFASWTAYQGQGLLTIVRGLEAALALVRVEAARQCRDTGGSLDASRLREAFRQADYTLNHLAAGEDLASAWSRAEHE